MVVWLLLLTTHYHQKKILLVIFYGEEHRGSLNWNHYLGHASTRYWKHDVL